MNTKETAPERIQLFRRASDGYWLKRWYSPNDLTKGTGVEYVRADKVTRLEQALRFPVEHGKDWILQDWQNWREWHARAALNDEEVSHV